MVNNVDKRVAILGGTFDPIHYGHLVMAEVIREVFSFDKIIFMPSGKPPHKKLHSVSYVEHRFNMVCNAIASNPYFIGSRIEIDRKGYTYTIDTLRTLDKMYEGSVKLHYIIGADVLHDLLTWKNYEEVFGICEFIAALRPGYEKDGFDRQAQYLRSTYSAKIQEVNIPLIDIASTHIRQKVKEGKSIRYLVPEAVETYIKENKLYLDAL
ncbi:MAG: nicotinate-nucleotide adenylyltransferase [Bacillota bacterium]